MTIFGDGWQLSDFGHGYMYTCTPEDGFIYIDYFSHLN